MDCGTSPGYFYAAGRISCAEHGGTHVDAPYHYSEHGATVDLLPLKDLIAPCRLIDITAQCAVEEQGQHYTLQPADILEHEAICGTLEPGTIVLIRTGWARRYPEGALAYLGFDEATQGPYSVDTSCLCFPGIGAEAAQVLVERKIVAVGLDTGEPF
jgi:kynurenine formamidase